MCPLAPQTNQSHSQQVYKHLLHADTAPDSPYLGSPAAFTRRLQFAVESPGPPPMTPAPQNRLSTASFRPSCPPRRRAWGPTSYPASVCFCTPPHTPQASIASPQALRAPLWQRKPWVLRPACSQASCSLTHPPSTQTSALFPENTSYPQPHRHLSPARYTLTFHLTCPGTPTLYTPTQPSALLPADRLTPFLFPMLCMCIPLPFTSLHKTPTPRALFPDTLSHAQSLP